MSSYLTHHYISAVKICMILIRLIFINFVTIDKICSIIIKTMAIMTINNKSIASLYSRLHKLSRFLLHRTIAYHYNDSYVCSVFNGCYCWPFMRFALQNLLFHTIGCQFHTRIDWHQGKRCHIYYNRTNQFEYTLIKKSWC